MENVSSLLAGWHLFMVSWSSAGSQGSYGSSQSPRLSPFQLSCCQKCYPKCAEKLSITFFICSSYMFSGLQSSGVRYPGLSLGTWCKGEKNLQFTTTPFTITPEISSHPRRGSWLKHQHEGVIPVLLKTLDSLKPPAPEAGLWIAE